MAFVNIALNCLGTEVSCDKPCSDGYEPENLLGHCGMFWRQLGFMAERFIKPPVTLTFKLPCPFYLESIVINPVVGSQRSSVIEIYSAAECGMKRSASSVPSRAGPSSSQNRTDGDHSQTEPVFKRIGFIRCSEPGKICFYNPRFRAAPSEDVHRTSQSYPHCSKLSHRQGAMLTAVDLISIRILGTANSTVPAIGKLEIWGMPSRAYPRRSELIQKYLSAVSPQAGTPESSVNHQLSSSGSENQNVKCGVMQNSEVFYKDHCKPAEHAQNTTHNAQNSNCVTPLAPQKPEVAPQKPEVAPQKPEVSSAVEIPEEFLDALTQEIMSAPTILPSGQCVDMSTLERFFEVEANYGRQPSDPYTGLLFTAHRKPVYNAALKICIDRFLMKHADEPSLRGVPRSVGHAQRAPKFSSNCNGCSAEEENVQTSCMLGEICWESKVSSVNGGLSGDTGQHHSQTMSQQPLSDYLTSKGAQSVSISPPAHKRTRAETDASGQSDSASPPAYKRMRTQADASVNQANTTTGVPTNRSQTVPSTGTRQEKGPNHIIAPIAALAKLLQPLRPPSYSRRPAVPPRPARARAVPISQGEQCSECQIKLKPTDILSRPTGAVVVYKFPCQHMVCRRCLVEDGRLDVSSEVKCSACGQLFAQSDLVRTHV